MKCRNVASFSAAAGTWLHSAPEQPIIVREEPDRPQPRLDRDAGNGMSVTIGRLQPDNVFDYRFVALSHNTIRGAAGAAILNAELLIATGNSNEKNHLSAAALLFISLGSAGYAQRKENKTPFKRWLKLSERLRKCQRDQGTRPAFMAFIAEDGILFRPTAVKGKQWMSGTSAAGIRQAAVAELVSGSSRHLALRRPGLLDRPLGISQ